MISHEHKAIFVHIPKTAGSSIEVALNATEQTNEGTIDEATGKFNPVTTGKEKHYNARECRRHYGRRIWNSYYKFTVVRNPWEKAHSWWWNKKEISGRIKLPFREFLLESLITSEKLPRSLRPQVSWITSKNGKIEMDFICRFENIEHDFRKVCRQINAPVKELPRILVENRKPPSRKHYTEEYDTELIRLIATVYAEDIALFGYTFGD